MKCNICPRQCNIDRTQGLRGYCGAPNSVRLARAALHYWEEPCISGKSGSGAVFFSGCNLKCIFCQNHDIAIGDIGKEVTIERLADIYLELQDKKANNINLVTASHYIDAVIKSVEIARNNGLNIPIIYNTSSYESIDSIKRLEGIVDVYLPDYKYSDSVLAERFSKAKDYPEIALKAIGEMIRQQPKCNFNSDGIIKTGVIIRQLILPAHTKNSIEAVKRLIDEYGNDIYISIMNQYTPEIELTEYDELNRTVTRREYEKVINAALDYGLKNGFFQEGETAKESFIPAFDYEGV